MKIIKISNGETRIGYELDELDKKAQERIFNWWIEFEIRHMTKDSDFYYLYLEMERNQTPWFLASEIYERHKEDIKNAIYINEYLFDEDGDTFPIIHHVNIKNEVYRHTWGKYDCEIINNRIKTKN